MPFESFELGELKQIRKNLDLSQTELAKLAGVSQSLIAKIESQKLDPTYSKAKKIFQTLNSLTKNKELTAKHIMHKKIIGVSKKDGVKKTIELMKKHQISQLPVIKGEQAVGVVTEGAVLDCLMNKRGECRIEEIMLDSPPIVSHNTSIDAISNLLRYFPIVLVSEDGKTTGLITKSDLIRKISK